MAEFSMMTDSVEGHAKPGQTFHKRPILFIGAEAGEFAKFVPFLSSRYLITETYNGHEALDLLEKVGFFLVVINLSVPSLDGFAIAKFLRESGKNRTAGVLMLAREGLVNVFDAQEAGYCDDYISLPYNFGSFLEKFWRLSDRLVERTWQDLPATERKFLKLTKEKFDSITRRVEASGRCDPQDVMDCTDQVVNMTISGGIYNVLDILWSYHQPTYVHSLRTCALMAILGVELGFQRADLQVLIQSGLLHDLGKIQIPLRILNKGEDLEPHEWALIKEHPVWSARFVRDTGELAPEVAIVAERHHERLDGSGYPHGLKGAQIDDLTLITSVADSFASLTDMAPYRDDGCVQSACEELTEMAKAKLEPNFTRVFLDIIKQRCFS